MKSMSLFDFDSIPIEEGEVLDEEEGIIFRVECKLSGYCVLKPKQISDIDCRTCSRIESINEL